MQEVGGFRNDPFLMTRIPLRPTSNMDDFRTSISGADNTLFGETLTRVREAAFLVLLVGLLYIYIYISVRSGEEDCLLA